MAVTIALGGDTMLGRGVGEVIADAGPEGLFAPEVRAAFAEADLAVLNLECCVSDRGRRWAAPGKPFHFRAPPEAVGVLTGLGVGCVTLANNHALDYGHEALEDTLSHLAGAGIAVVGAGRDREEAREPAVLERAGTRVAVIGVTDHPSDFAASETTPGVAYAPLSEGVPSWLSRRIEDAAAEHDVVLVTPHWGPNMTSEPLPYVRRAAEGLLNAGATLVAGHSAHVFHGVNGNVLYDLGDLIDDYATDEYLRNELGLAWRVEISDLGEVRVTALPLKLDYARTGPARDDDRTWIVDRLRSACAGFAAEVAERGPWLAIRPSAAC
ncbi:CapA family protein [Actinoallomurus iriomotensis]|uniref:Capsular polysaccharide biosynthesis protein n=1 Tax=Actinoallomurus iriomotensis TaxID=478107 RepID=A0A9W6S901_9ACTN|nr:CapA family protein [Actinoallomurus iriomotensis]GLY88022.1 capsular polysaccharide biosynthesis protein [Actinoallomurus iriomotensis]